MVTVTISPGTAEELRKVLEKHFVTPPPEPYLPQTLAEQAWVHQCVVVYLELCEKHDFNSSLEQALAEANQWVKENGIDETSPAAAASALYFIGDGD